MVAVSTAALSKTRYLSGLQCAKRLWTEVRAPELVPPLDSGTQALFEQGREVGRLAARLFPGGIEISPASRQWAPVIEATRRALTQRRPIYEAGFRTADAACRVDLLVPVGDRNWDLYEVKSSTTVKEVYLEDVALQAHVVQGTGLPLGDCYVVHLNRSYVRAGDLVPEDLFRSVRVTEEVRQRLDSVPGRLEAMNQILRSGSRPDVAIGPHCLDPFPCPLRDECWAFLPPVSVFDLVGARQRAFRWLQQGLVDLAEIPEEEDLSAKQRIQLETWRSGRAHVDRHSIRSFLETLRYPIHFYDIETFGAAVPVLDQSRPYQQIPFLFSVHRIEEPGASARHFSYLHGEEGDPRPDFLRATRSALGPAGSIVAYHAAFERRILTETAEQMPEMQQWASQLTGRFVDLLMPFRSFAYHHPDQLGSSSLKAVLPTLTDLSYDDLEIRDGETASREYLRVTYRPSDPIERARIQRQLERYCGLDTLGMVAIVEKLRELAR